MTTELPPDAPDALDEDGADGGFDELVNGSDDLDSELGDDVTLDDAEAAA